MKQVFISFICAILLCLILIPISIFLQSEVLLTIAIMGPIVFTTLALVIFWQITNLFPKNDISDYYRITIPNTKESIIYLEFVNNNGIWCYQHNNNCVKINLTNYMFPISFIRAYLIRQIRYKMINCKLPISYLFRKKLHIKKYASKDIYVRFINKEKIKEIIIVKDGLSKYTLLSQLISQSPYYKNYLFMKTVVSLNKDKEFIDESIYDKMRKKKHKR